MGRGKRKPQQSKQSKANTDHVEERQKCEEDNVEERQQFDEVPNEPKEQAMPRKPPKRGKKTDPEEEDDTEEIEMEESLFQRLFKSLKKSFGGVPSRGRGKNKSANEPPFNIPPSKTSASIFELKNPFVTVTEDPKDVKGNDKVRLAQEEPMHVDAIRRLVRELVVPVIESKKACQARTELGYRDIHISFLRPFVRVVVPWKARPTKSVSSRNKRQKILQEDGGNEGVYFVFELSGYTDPSDLVMKYEGDGETPATTADRFDIRVMVHNSRIESGDSLVTVAYVECKKDDDDLPEAIFQAGSYGKPAAFENMQRGRFSPIFLQGFSKTKWKHGILVPHGSVTVEDGKVVSFQSILPQDTVDSLNGVLKLATKDLKFAYPMWNAYPSGVYLLGLLYIDPKDRYLPLLNGEKDDALFYQTWLQIVAGQDARKLTRDEIDERCTRSVAGYHEEYDAYLEQMAESRNLV